jgi:ankyrin repeat protein
MKVLIFQEQLVASKGPAEDTALHLAARKGDNDLVKFFIEAGAKVDAQNVSAESKTEVPLWGEESTLGTESGIE